MNTAAYLRYLLCLLFGVATAVTVWLADRKERGLFKSKKIYTRYNPYFDPLLLPVFALGLFLLLFLERGIKEAAEYVIPLLFQIFLHLALYNTILLVLLPVLRKRISSRVCAALWILPNTLYIVNNALMVPGRPLFIVPVPFLISKVILIIWVVGFFAVLLWNFVSHLMFRKRLLKNAGSIYDRATNQLWQQVQDESGFSKPYIPIVYTHDTATPLSIGFFKKTTYVVLPMQHYTQEELHLIFRHEAMHMARKDCRAKLFMVFCTAMCWFNPLMWIALRRSTEDMELSCDETVLMEENKETRALYANLLLRTAGTDRGFSTCLSSSAKSMLYRLENTVKPGKRRLGSITAGLIMFGILISSGLISIAYAPATASECILASGSYESFILKKVSLSTDGSSTDYDCTDTEALNEYWKQLDVYRLSAYYEYPEDKKYFTASYQAPNGLVHVSLSNNKLSIWGSVDGKVYIKSYYHQEEIDWAYLENLLAAQ